MSFQLYLKVSTLCLLAVLVACDASEKQKTDAKPNPAIALNDANIDKFTLRFAKQYLTTSNDLINAFEKFKTAGDSSGFIQYRNYEWTPNYIEKNDYYQAVRGKSKQYLANTNAMRLFDPFERLIYIGIDLKKGFLNNNQKQIKSAYTNLKQDRKVVEKILTLAPKANKP